MATTTTQTLIAAVRRAAHPLSGAAADYDPLLDRIGDASFVLIGEATHGTHEFYEQRAEITKRLICEKGFTAVAAEADWPDAYRVNCYVRGETDDQDSVEALAGFKRFPAWMWCNADVLDFVGWLRAHNDSLPADDRVGFYGLDLYSLHASIDALVGYLDKVDPEAAKRARERYACFEHLGRDTQTYGWATSLGLAPSCEAEAVRQLVEMQQRVPQYARRDGRLAQDEAFYALQNARLVKDAEQYYRSMFHGAVESWNLRDRHMAETLDALVAHQSERVGTARVVVWAHNSHVGDARATQMGADGEWNVGQIVREEHGRDAALVGFTTYSGTVTAASEWGGPAERKWVRPALRGSYEDVSHDVGIPSYMLVLDGGEAAATLSQPRLERAIGVVYLPETERTSHYFYARLPEQFDAVIHFDETRAVEPLERTSEWERGELPETYPWAM